MDVNLGLLQERRATGCVCSAVGWVLGKIFGPEREEVTRNWGKVQSAQIHNL